MAARTRSGGHRSPPEAEPAPARPKPWPVVSALVAALVVVAGIAAIVVLREPPPGPDPQRVAELEASEDARHVEQVGELVDQTRAAREALLPVLEGLDAALPADGSAPAGEPGDDEVAGWRSTADDVAADFQTAPSGDTGHNVARGGLRSAVELLASSVSVYESAREAEGDRRERLEETAGELRTQSVRAWSVAATQLDVVSIDAGHGHVHIFLPASPGSEALIPDSAPEGSGARGEADG
ncbi:hypothetical protein HDA32_003330 [Spinactinospora alkalitolerans]|uniref:Uncharacterized protein n=1 Tax=Spinactinospora alkalitolerans TaxID=687207 RepID=A0A852U2M7_9ACTN|nr:hypothetical protein [Spinactinospora alkalitolerans]NYE48210.1 hypothetical protein [Spinactinospora alkalitolerans]